MNHSTVNRRTAIGLGIAALASASSGVWASTWPNRPIKLIVAGPPGSGMDIYARMLQMPLQLALKQPVIIEYKAGANSLIGTEAVAKAAPDGYSLLFTPSSAIALNPVIQAKMPYDTLKDLQPVNQVGQSGILLVAHPKSGFKTMQDVVRYAKENPGKLTYGSWGSGSTGHLAMEAIKAHYGLDLFHVPYKGTASLINDLLANNIAVGFTDVASPVPHVRAGKLNALGISGSRRGPALSEVPTLTEQGFKFDLDGWYGLFAPSGTPDEIIHRLNQEVNKILATEETRKHFAVQNMSPSPVKTAEQFAATVRTDSQAWQNLAKVAKLKLD